MEERPISFNLLHKDELEYEVRIREAKPADTVVALRAQARTLNKELPADEIVNCDLDITVELVTIKEKLDSLEKLMLDSSSKTCCLKSLNRIQALAHHLFHRITRLDSEENVTFASKINSFQERLNTTLAKLDSIMHIFKSSLTKSLSLSSDTNHNSQNLPSEANASIHKLNFRYNGKTCVKAFLQRLGELCLSRGISDIKLFNSASELFTDEALCWYRGVQDEVHSWSDLRQLLLEEYLPPDYDHRLMQEVRARTQGSDESIINYLSIMQNYFSRFTRSVSDEEKLNIVLFNIRPFYTAQLALNPVESWADLKRKCRLLEGAKERSEHFTEPPKITSSCLAPDLGRPCFLSAWHTPDHHVR